MSHPRPFGESHACAVSCVFPIYREHVSLEAIAEAENLLNISDVACNASGCGGAVVTRFRSRFERIDRIANLSVSFSQTPA